MEVLQYKDRKASKDHKCDYCLGVINKGEVYGNSSIKNDGVYTWKSHKRCEELVEKLKMNDGEGVCDDTFYDCIYEKFSDIMGGDRSNNPKLPIMMSVVYDHLKTK